MPCASADGNSRDAGLSWALMNPKLRSRSSPTKTAKPQRSETQARTVASKLNREMTRPNIVDEPQYCDSKVQHGWGILGMLEFGVWPCCCRVAAGLKVRGRHAALSQAISLSKPFPKYSLRVECIARFNIAGKLFNQSLLHDAAGFEG